MLEIILDTETTGLDPKNGHRIIEIGCIELNRKVKTGRVFHKYIHPERDVPEEAFKIHGISTASLQDKPIFSAIADEFIDFIGDAKLVIHNAQFDMKFLNHELSLLKLPNISNDRVIDTLMLARKRFPGSPASLDALCRRFNIDLSARTKHGALLDAELLTEVYIELLGGSQSMMFFEQPGNKIEMSDIKRKYREMRNFPIDQHEEEAHKEFLNKIKNPLWNKIIAN